MAPTFGNMIEPGLIQPGELVMLQDTAEANEKDLKFYCWWTGLYLVRSVTRGRTPSVLQHQYEEKVLYWTHHNDDIRPRIVSPEHLRYPPGAPIDPEFPTNLRQYRKGFLPHQARKFDDAAHRGRGDGSEGEGRTRKRRRV